ncbi:MAG: hypothetical protein JO107_11870 [Hyphomicrobiales bacterium]|nr:hypothetical protein [Hyphomicrobiales bacterium]MBV8663791.1 hypothetical protein [Hyphomicrobiales bacterium]
MTETRKIAAILVSDVVGYSRLASVDEERTLATLRALRSDVVAPAVAAHNGRIVKSTGDGALVEFRSVVDSVRCALEIQQTMSRRNAGVSRDRRILFRIGIHVGDVVEEDDGDLMGHGVNVAARLEGVAKPGAICLSEDAYRQVKAKLDLKVTDLGKTQLKNIEPMRVYALAAGGAPKRGTLGWLADHRLEPAAWIVSGAIVASGLGWLYFGGAPQPALPALTEASQGAAPSAPEPLKPMSVAKAVQGPDQGRSQQTAPPVSAEGSPASSETATLNSPEPPKRSNAAKAVQPQRPLLTARAARLAQPVAPTPTASDETSTFSGSAWRHDLRQECILMGGCLNAESVTAAPPNDAKHGACAHGAHPQPSPSPGADAATFGDGTWRTTHQTTLTSSATHDGCM